MKNYFIPQTAEDLNFLKDSGASEGPWLEFKSADLLGRKNDQIFDVLSKEITAFANSDGGVLIVGIEEGSERHISRIVPVLDPSKNESWFENGLLPRIYPLVSYAIKFIPFDEGQVIVFDVPASFSGPHQAGDKRFYARRQFRVDPLLPFEIEDIRRRKPKKGCLAEIRMVADEGSINFAIENSGSEPIFDVKIRIPGVENIEIAHQWNPGLRRPYTEPFKQLNSGEHRHFPGGGYEIFVEKLHDRMIVAVDYCDSQGRSYTNETVYFLKDLDTTVRERGPFEGFAKDGVAQLRILNDRLREISRSLTDIKESAFSSSGLALSKTTLEAILGNSELKWPGWLLNYNALSEILDVDITTALKIQQQLFAEHHLVGGQNVSLDDFDVSDEVKDKIRRRLNFPATDE